MANDFTGDAVALWRFEDGALGTNSIGNNDLTSAAAGSASADAKEGSSAEL